MRDKLAEPFVVRIRGEKDSHFPMDRDRNRYGSVALLGFALEGGHTSILSEGLQGCKVATVDC